MQHYDVGLYLDVSQEYDVIGIDKSVQVALPQAFIHRTTTTMVGPMVRRVVDWFIPGNYQA